MLLPFSKESQKHSLFQFKRQQPNAQRFVPFYVSKHLENTLKTSISHSVSIDTLKRSIFLLKTFIVLEMRYKQLSHCLSTQSVPVVNKKFFFPSASGSTTSGFLLIPSSSFPSPPPHAVHICNPNAIRLS